MSATSLLRPLRNNTGTLFVFKSAANDLAKTLSDDNIKFNFSKFIALDLPETKNPSNFENTMRFQLIGNKIDPNNFDNTVITDMLDGPKPLNAVISNSIQNNLFNWENIILSKPNNFGDEYVQTNKTVTERIFWRWLSDLGAIRFKDADSSQTETLNLFSEEDENGIDTYRKVVKYLGDISLINNVSKGGDGYTEIYLHIPTEHGSTPDVLFRTVIDTNYGPNYSWVGSQFIEGRTSTTVPNMSINTWAHDFSNFSYNTANSFSDSSNIEVLVSNSTNGDNPYPVKVSNLDGVVVNWNIEDYKRITDRVNVNTFADFNQEGEAEDFSFNAVAIYYDITDQSNPSNVSRNLYGILFLEDFSEGPIGNGKLKSFRKFKPNETTRVNGNSYSLKTNIKFNPNSSGDEIVRSINEFTTFSMDLFSDAMVTLQTSLGILNTQSLKLMELGNKVDNLEKFYFTQSSITDLKNEVLSLSSKVNNALIALEDPSTILELIRKNSQRINDLVNGNLGELSYDLSPFRQGLGIKIDKGTPGRVNIENIVQDYNNINTCANVSGNLSTSLGNGNISDVNMNNILSFGAFSNYYKESDNLDIINNLVINIADINNKFKKGQVYKIYFNNVNMSSGNEISIYTDATNRFGLGSYKLLVGKIGTDDLISNKPIIEIVCTDETLYKFEINILR